MESYTAICIRKMGAGHREAARPHLVASLYFGTQFTQDRSVPQAPAEEYSSDALIESETGDLYTMNW